MNLIEEIEAAVKRACGPYKKWEDDCADLIAAIKLLKGVVSVQANVATPSDFAAKERAKHELRMEILHLIV